MLTSNIGEAAAMVHSRDGLAARDIELFFAPVLFLDEGLTPPSGHGFSIAVVCLQPRSVGKLTLRSSIRSNIPTSTPRSSPTRRTYGSWSKAWSRCGAWSPPRHSATSPSENALWR